MTTSTPPAWHFLHECDVPVTIDGLSIHARNLPVADAFRERNDSPDPTYQDCWPSERYKSDGPECERTAQLTDAHSNAAPSHRIGTCYEDPDTGEYVMPGDFYGEKELRWMPDKSGDRHDAEPLVTVAESCPECGAVTDIDYGPESALLPKRESGAEEETFDVPFPVQSWLFEALIEREVDHLHEIIDDHHDEIVKMARKRHEKGFIAYGSKGYSWDAKTRLRNVLEELSDGGVYLTMGPIG